MEWLGDNLDFALLAILAGVWMWGVVQRLDEARSAEATAAATELEGEREREAGAGQQAAPDPGYPKHWEADVVLRDGATAHLRPIRPEDQQLLLDMFHQQSENTIYLRFFSHKTTLTRRELARYTTVDHRDRVCFVILLGTQLIGFVAQKR